MRSQSTTGTAAVRQARRNVRCALSSRAGRPSAPPCPSPSAIASAAQLSLLSLKEHELILLVRADGLAEQYGGEQHETGGTLASYTYMY